MDKNNLEKLESKLLTEGIKDYLKKEKKVSQEKDKLLGIYENMEIIWQLSDPIIQDDNRSEDLQNICEKIFGELDSLLED